MNKLKKVAVIGLPGVGKSTLVKMLSGQNIPSDYIPTVALDFGNVQIGSFKISLWDLGGQDQFRFLYDSFLPGTHTILIVTDSTLAGVQKTKVLVDKYKNSVPNFVIIANKQDLPGALLPNEVKSILGAETYGLIAINPNNKQILYKILEQ
ncbi:MAG: ADP-ribosylation factor-like protein [Promethearchaeota archaeon]